MLIKFVKNYLKKRSKLFNALSYYNNEKHFDYTKIKFGSIGKNCRIHPDCRISDPDKVIIGDNVFIGLGAIILPGAEVGRNVVIGAGCIVRGKIPEDSIVVGNPSKVTGSLSEKAELWVDRMDDIDLRVD